MQQLIIINEFRIKKSLSEIIPKLLLNKWNSITYWHTNWNSTSAAVDWLYSILKKRLRIRQHIVFKLIIVITIM